MKRTRSFAALILCCLLAAPLLAQKSGPPFPFDFKPMGLSKLKDFGITDDQIQQIGQIYQGNRNNLIDLEADVAKRENDLRGLLRTPQVDPAQAERAVDAVIEARGKLARSTTMMMVRMRQLMSLDQWEKLSEYQEQLSNARFAPPPSPGTEYSPSHPSMRLPPLPPPPDLPGVYRTGRDGVSAPQVIFKVEPGYTERARNAKVQGSVGLYVVIGPDGVPRDIRIARSLDPDLDQKAIEALSQWRFKPGMKDGQPVPVQATIEVTFRLL